MAPPRPHTHARARTRTTARTTTAVLSGLAVLATAGCGSGFGSSGGQQQTRAGNQRLTVLIAPSSTAETTAVKQAVAGYEKTSGNQVTVQTAADINQQLGQAFSGGNPPDVFYVNSDQFANYAQGGSLYPYGDKIWNLDAYPKSLLASFSNDGKQTCVPKDGSSLALAVNPKLWKAAGLTDKDHPRTWDDLERVAKKLTKGKVTGLVTSEEYQRLGAFMKQAGGWVTNASQTTMTADSKANEKGLDFVKKGLNAGWWKFSKQVDALNAGEAFGQGKAAMTIEGSWLDGQLAHDYPDTDYKLFDLPEGPGGKGNLAFTTCWGVAQKSRHRDAAVDLVQYLSTSEQQQAMAEKFGAIPVRESSAEAYFARHPEFEPWSPMAKGVQGPTTVKGMDKPLAQFNSELLNLRSAAPKTILGNLQHNGEPVIKEAQR
ncbi:sugar ABC transporter substrate-binding protein [Streptomyces endophyticus]|uniref:Extracellular solute-binding protein n=1 Tax=Streptomyces endophyticus TaxID=714166 RepID=A0ABU6EWK2_9ACTN|nr:extracellular solute-binding protein [Streptomyces endophyticus]MEB8336052.1 extracellular solute-binding protein [Streptomyces endophyticus]